MFELSDRSLALNAHAAIPMLDRHYHTRKGNEERWYADAKGNFVTCRQALVGGLIREFGRVRDCRCSQLAICVSHDGGSGGGDADDWSDEVVK